jgi:[glutamine synthetase] adenylyltransferase / [glutamine synthetase]-adenylyl-L-tyrosine phosphorylase
VITPEVLGRALGEAPNPELARIAVSRIGERPVGRELLQRPEIIPPAARLLGFSSAASDFFLSHPEELESLAGLRAHTAAELTAEASADASTLGPDAGLRRFRRRAAYRVAAADLAGTAVEGVMAELSAIAKACLAVALKAVDGEHLAVIAMGKLGGAELNYSSDVDVLFLHGEGGEGAQEAAVRAVSRLIEALAEPTSEGVALRVDPNLRPEGRAGPLSRSIDSMLEYYERYAATWERQALLKARPVAGDDALGRRFVEGVAPFVFPAVLPATAIEDVRASKARIEEHVRARGKERSELKRGRGGIRDVEFAVQLLQLVHGRRERSLREPNTLLALSALAEEGFVAPDDAEALARSYRFLRRLEHRLQMVRDTQTHELPSDLAALGPLARSMGFASADILRSEYERHTDIVRDLHERLFYRPLLEAFAGAPSPPPGTDREATEELLAALGFSDPAGGYRAFAQIVDPATRLGKVLGTLFPVIAPSVAFAASPDAALTRFGRVTDALQRDDRIADAMANRPDGARRLAALVSTSSAFSDVLAADPGLASAVFELPAGQRALFPGDDRAELVRVAAAYASGELKVPEVGRRLSAVADWLLARAVSNAGSRDPFAVLGLGKLGGEELAFGSDLDVLFVYEGEGPADFRAASDVAEVILAHVRASGWQADADLRPEGRSGPLARSMPSYLEYWQRWADTWEFQALLRARFVAGDEQLARRFLSNAADFSFPEALSMEHVIAIRRMRVRMEEERVKPREARRFHFKLGYGSLADVQWAVELSLMRHGFAHPEVRRTNTLEALEALAAGHLMEDSVARSLGEAYIFLSEIKNTLEIERRVPADAIPPTPEGQAALARRLGYEERPRHRFLQDYRRVTRAARLAMERVFYGDD